jgi:hypothetical protein
VSILAHWFAIPFEGLYRWLRCRGPRVTKLQLRLVEDGGTYFLQCEGRAENAPESRLWHGTEATLYLRRHLRAVGEPRLVYNNRYLIPPGKEWPWRRDFRVPADLVAQYSKAHGRIM